jgi:hypothetical protein
MMKVRPGNKAIKSDYEFDRAITVDLSENPLLTCKKLNLNKE